MTGKDIIHYILDADLENKEVFDEKGMFVGFMSEKEATDVFNVGVSTIRAWYELGMINAIKVGDTLYLLKDTVDPRRLRLLEEFMI